MMIPADKLHQIDTAIHRELCRSISKYGTWDQALFLEMWQNISNELDEVYEAGEQGDDFGEHGAYNELAQVAACCKKMMYQILRRQEQASPTAPGA